MRMFSNNGVRRPKGFTLVELLVVIGIIAVLLSILIPTLAGARRAAYVVQCQSNMKQIATAMIMYIQDNKGVLPPATVPSGGPLYPSGWWWASELVKQKYVPVDTAMMNDATVNVPSFAGASCLLVNGAL